MRTIAPIGKKYRISSDSAWPLRRADGRTFAESKHDLSHHTGVTKTVGRGQHRQPTS